jgi:exosortase C (VPDSG-CTERM-specific)
MKRTSTDAAPNPILGNHAEGATEPYSGKTSFRGGERFRLFALFAVLLSAAFAKPLFELSHYSLTSDLYSHILLIPFVSAYIIWKKLKGNKQQDANRPLGTLIPGASSSPALAMIPLAIGLVTLNGWFQAKTLSLEITDRLALGVFSYLCLLLAGAFLTVGAARLRFFAFPVAFLIFVVPMPSFVRQGIDHFFQYASADATALLFHLSGTTVFREGLVFQVPGIALQVAEECSGIRSSLVLFITSLLAGYMFLRSPWKRAALTLFVIPLAIIRNGIRIFTIAMLCVHVDPSMIDSAIHRRGGPLFFALSLIPFFLLLIWLRRTERIMPASPQSGEQGGGRRQVT